MLITPVWGLRSKHINWVESIGTPIGHELVALSNAEAEFRGMAKGLCELLWLRRLLTKIGYSPCCEMNLLCDNKTAIDIAYNLVQHDWTKHVEVYWHFIKKNLEVKIIWFPFFKLEDQLADILTKTVCSWASTTSMHQLEGECRHELYNPYVTGITEGSRLLLYRVNFP